MTRRAWALGVAMLAVLATPAGAQPAVSNLLEAQAGNMPFLGPRDRTDVYDQFQLEYGFPRGRVGLRFEQDRNSEDLFNYDAITQRWAEWSDERLRVRVGNFYTILGRGLIHRSFELPAVVLDQVGVRSRYGPSRDVDGVLVEGGWGPVSARLLSGTPNSGETSAAPENEQFGLRRYTGLLSGGQVAATVWREARVGAAYLRASNGIGTQREFGTGFLEFDPLHLAGVDVAAMPVYLEYAQADRRFGDWWHFRTGDQDTFAFYATTGVLAGPFTLAAEWKDYREFRLGINDPPSLVREHTYALLNRGTHVLDAARERGYQLEGSWTMPRWGTATVNLSRSDGVGVRFDERFVEVRVAPEQARRWEASLFWDEGKDEFSFISDRRVIGGSGTVRLLERWSVAADVERQDATREFVGIPSPSFREHYASLTVSRAGLGSLTGSIEHTRDPEQEDPALAGDAEVDPRVFLAGTIRATISEHHDATLFFGERRGGRACTAGTCYEVQAFEGVELRLVTRF